MPSSFTRSNGKAVARRSGPATPPIVMALRHVSKPGTGFPLPSTEGDGPFSGSPICSASFMEIRLPEDPVSRVKGSLGPPATLTITSGRREEEKISIALPCASETSMGSYELAHGSGGEATTVPAAARANRIDITPP